MKENTILEKKYTRLRHWLQEKEKVIIAFSGGVDSTTLLAAAVREKGVEVLALIVESELMTQEENSFALNFLQKNNIPFQVLRLSLLENHTVQSNPPDRCYHCKLEIFKAISTLAKKENFPHILEGSNADDLKDYRPGKKALEELHIESPLQELDFSKNEIRKLARHFDLPVWDRPSSPCLATRFPAGVILTEERLRALEIAESRLRNIGLKNLRLRLHDETARLEVSPDEIGFCTDEKNRQKIIDIMKETGARYISLDLEGYRTGSMNTREKE